MTAMGYVDDDGKTAGGEQSMNWTLALTLGIPSGSIILLVGLLLIGLWIGPASGPDRIRATVTHQPAPMAVPVLPPSNLAAAVESRKAALLAAEGRELDLLIIVDAPSEMSADEVADQVAELANRLRCKIKVQHKGRKVQASPGMSRKGFVKQATGFSADDGVCLAIVVTALAGCWILFEKF
jgi:hypothetical protein